MADVPSAYKQVKIDRDMDDRYGPRGREGLRVRKKPTTHGPWKGQTHVALQDNKKRCSRKKMVKKVRKQVRVCSWSRVDKGVKNYMKTDHSRPDWRNVKRRTTIDLDTNQVIEDIVVSPNMSDRYLERRLPENVHNTKTTLIYEIPKQEYMKKLMLQWSFQETDLGSTMMTQYHVSKGLKVFGNNGVKAVSKEMKQLHDIKVLKLRHPSEMSEEDKYKALKYLMFLKEKRDGEIKGRGCADGRPQRKYTAKEEASSQTVHNESMMLQCVINAMEERDVATGDIPNAFMQADMDEHVA